MTILPFLVVRGSYTIAWIEPVLAIYNSSALHLYYLSGHDIFFTAKRVTKENG